MTDSGNPGEPLRSGRLRDAPSEGRNVHQNSKVGLQKACNLPPSVDYSMEDWKKSSGAGGAVWVVYTWSWRLGVYDAGGETDSEGSFVSGG